MNLGSRKLFYFLFGVLIIAVLVSASGFAASQSFIGIVGDAMCGAKHVMPGDAASCTRECRARASKYALLAGEKVYTLDTNDKAVLSMLDKWAGERVTITGSKKNDIITVLSVKPAR